MGNGEDFSVRLRVGENRLLIVVTSPNELSSRTYMVTVYVLMESLTGASLSYLALADGEPPPPRAVCRARSTGDDTLCGPPSLQSSLATITSERHGYHGACSR